MLNVLLVNDTDWVPTAFNSSSYNIDRVDCVDCAFTKITDNQYDLCLMGCPAQENTLSTIQSISEKGLPVLIVNPKEDDAPRFTTRNIFKVINQAFYDSTTNFYRQDAFQDILDEYVRLKGQFTLCMVDIDNFKQINDTYGHNAGNKALKSFSESLCSSLRSCDIVGRYGGDEFAVILPGTSEQDAYLVFDRIRRDISTTMTYLGGIDSAFITASFGIAGYSDNLTAEQIIERADIALYRAKRAGRDRLFVYEDNEPCSQLTTYA